MNSRRSSSRLPVTAPIGEQFFGRAVARGGGGDLEEDCYYAVLELEKPDHMEGVAEFLLGTLEYCYGWNPDDSLGWECTYDSWKDEPA